MAGRKQPSGVGGNPVFRLRCECGARRTARRVGRQATPAYPYADPDWAAMVCPACDGGQ